MRFGQLGNASAEVTLSEERISNLVTNLLALSPEELALLLQQLPQRSEQELFVRISNSSL